MDYKVVILAGGRGTRLSEETLLRPKPMVEIGGRPILWHIMKIYSHYGFHDFIICLGYKGYMIKEYFANYFIHQSDITIDIKNNSIKVHQNGSEPWRVTLVDTGENTMTGGRIRRVEKFLGNDTFLLTYGDGVGDVNIDELVRYHKEKGKLVTLTSARPSGRFGTMNLDEDNLVRSFYEKKEGDGAWVNAGFFVMERGVMDYIDGDSTTLEREPLENLARDGQLMAYKHEGFWKPMDTLRDRMELEELWSTGKPPWKVWR